MTKFEQFLIDNGYIKFIINTKTWKYEIPKYHTISTMSNIDHRYIHNDDPLLKKIQNDEIIGKGITFDDRRGEIRFGLHEHKKPPTLIYPRPKMEVNRDGIVTRNYITGDGIFGDLDDNMNVVLQQIDHVEILKSMYDGTIIKINI